MWELESSHLGMCKDLIGGWRDGVIVVDIW